MTRLDDDHDRRLPDLVQDHALDLLCRHRIRAPADAVHIDVGCCFDPEFAERLGNTLGLVYVAAGLDGAGLATLSADGIETHHLELGSEDAMLASLRALLGGRMLVSVTFLDVLHTLANGPAVLRAVARLAAGGPALVVVSVPNAADAEIAARLVLGRLDGLAGRPAGEAHPGRFTGASLKSALRIAGLHSLDRNDTRHRLSERLDPHDHPLLARGSEIGTLLRSLRRAADPENADIAHLVWLCAPGPADGPAVPKTDPAESRPFLSVVLRTQARRPHTLQEALLCLLGQSDRDMEILIMGHRLTQKGVDLVEGIIADHPQEIRALCRLIRVEDGNRTRPLNVGFAEARGRYIAILDDDDIVFAHWVETFRRLHSRSPGQVLRAACVRQTVRNVSVQGRLGLRGEDSPKRIYDAEFDMIEHLRGNQTPPVTLAFPRGVFHDFGLHFDEALSTTEDWDFLMRTALLVGVASSVEVTSIYRWWESDESSRSLHEQEEWDRNYRVIVAKLNSQPLLLPPGSATRLRQLLEGQDPSRTRVESDRPEASPHPGPILDHALSTASSSASQTSEAALEVARLRRELADLHEALDRSLTLRFARLTPGIVRKMARPTIRLTWRALGGRFWYGLMRRD